MSDVLPAIEPEQSGQVTKLDVGLGDYLSHSYQAGQSESMLSALSNVREDEIANHPNQSKLLQPDEANQKYGVGGLKFTQPVQESLASTMSEREKNKMDQEMYLYSGATKGRFLPGMAASILGATANPVDFGSMFIPFVGTGGKMVEGARIMNVMRRGLIPMEAFSKIPASKLVASMAQATMWQGMAEVPKMWEAHVEGQEMPHVGMDLLGQAAFAGALHGAGSLLRMISPATHDVMTKQAMDDFLQDKDTSANQYLPLDEHVIQWQAINQEIALRHEAEGSIDLKKIAEDYKDKNLEYSVAAALRMPADETGQQAIHTGPTHWAIPEYTDAGAERGMWTNKGRFVSMDEANKLHGLLESEHPTSEQILYGAESHDEMSPGERKIYADLLETGHTDAQAMNTVRSARKERMEQAFFSKPEVQQKIEDLRQKAVDKWVSDKKQELANPVKPETVRAAAEKTVPKKVTEKYNGDDAHLNKSLDEDIEGLTGKRPEKQDVNPDFEEHQELVKSLKGKNLDEAQPIASKIEALKKKYGGMVPPEKMPVVNAIDTAVNCALEKLL